MINFENVSSNEEISEENEENAEVESVEYEEIIKSASKNHNTVRNNDNELNKLNYCHPWFKLVKNSQKKLIFE